MFRTKALLLVDSIGAAISCVSLGLVLPRFQSLVGMPHKELMVLALIAGAMALFSGLSYFLSTQKWPQLLVVVSGLNFTYSCITAALLVYHSSIMGFIGFVYFFVELAVIIPLAIVELRVGRRNSV